MKRLMIVAVSLSIGLVGVHGVASAQQNTVSTSETVTTTHNGQSETTASSEIVNNGEIVSHCDFVENVETGVAAPVFVHS